MQLVSQRRLVHVAAKIFVFLVLWFLAARSSPAQSASQEKSDAPQQPAAPEKQAEKDQKPPDPTLTKLRIQVTADDKPIGNASVYVKFYASGGLFHKEKLAELNLKTNEDGSVKVPEIPRGKVLIQVIAKGWHTYGKWYDIEDAEQTIQIKLVPPSTHWY
jgi:hypothetical protein